MTDVTINDDDDPFDREAEEQNLIDAEDREESRGRNSRKPAGEVGRPDNLDDPFDDGDDDDDDIDADGADDDDDPETGDAADDDAEDDDDDNYGRKVKKRIAAEVSKTKRSQQEAERERARADAAEQRLANLERQREQLKQADAAEADLTKKREEARSRLREAKENGDTDTEMDATDELTGINTKLTMVQEFKKRAEAAPVADPNAGQQRTQQRQAGQPHQKGAAWIDRNAAWWGSDDHADAKAFVLGLDAKMTRAGMDQNSDDYYERFDAELRKRFPEVPLSGRRSAQSERQRQPNRKTPVGAATRSTGRRKDNPNVVRITKEDRAQMETFGLDPNDKEAVAEFARERRVTQRASQEG